MWLSCLKNMTKKYFLFYQYTWMGLQKKHGIYKEKEGYVLHHVY